MQYRTLGDSGLEVSAVGLGTWSMGGRWWGEPDDTESTHTIRKALACGINFIDTADVYGFGHSEKLLGRILGKERKNVILATKVGIRWNADGDIRNDLSADYVLQACEASLQRLRTEFIDLYQIHWPDPNTPVEETAQALQQCVDSGKVRFVGASNLSPEQLHQFRRFIPVVSLQPPLNLFERHAEVQLLPICLKKNIGVISYSSLCKGLLTEKFLSGENPQEAVRKRDPLFHGAVFKKNVQIVRRLQEYAVKHGRTVTELALAWVLAHPSLSSALCGARSPRHIERQIRAVSWKLAHEDLQAIDKILQTTVGE